MPRVCSCGVRTCQCEIIEFSNRSSQILYLILYVEELTRYEKLPHDVLTAQKTFEEELDDSIVKSVMTLSLSQRRKLNGFYQDECMRSAELLDFAL
ncbi:hypothetical protein NPIL_271241, partial [Nephila pilipes]